MKIQPQLPVSAVEALQRAEAKPAVAPKKGASDVGASVKLSSAAVALSDGAGDVGRSQHIAELKAAFERGDKIVDHDRIADAMIMDAEESP